LMRVTGDAMLLAHMRVYDEEVVERVMNYLEPMLGKERRDRLMQLYRLVRAGMILDSIVASYLSFKEKKGKPRYIEYEDDIAGKVVEVNEYADKSEGEVLSELKEELDYARRHSYTLEDMIKGVWLSDWTLNIVPKFTHLYYDGSKDILVFVKESIRDTLEAIGVRVPHKFDSLVEEGYKLVKELDEQLKVTVKE